MLTQPRFPRFYQRLAQEIGRTDVTCSKCLTHHLATLGILMPEAFTFRVGTHACTWAKAKMDAFAQNRPVRRLPWANLESLLAGCSHDPQHLTHLPPHVRMQPAYLMEVSIVSSGVRTAVIADGQHRATLALREGRDLPVIHLPASLEPRCRTDDRDAQQIADALQGCGLFTYELQVIYALSRTGSGVCLGRFVQSADFAREAFFQPARNASVLHDQVRMLVPSPGASILMPDDLPRYVLLSRAARFDCTMAVAGQIRPVTPIIHGHYDLAALKVLDLSDSSRYLTPKEPTL
ncbi:MAG: hypothetical protein EI684_04565 [Candidatus Viridilinea halotolerans]|uniref:Uncharacterized protein n=1 Tax=Candidatus Viridilinea halotolerans TaxID=2491704 RepID=A0A426U696_9CHLR|nr:MAG: hypothetical protein EI684_04565 [Candidatus Viridilinea halotolerans]